MFKRIVKCIGVAGLLAAPASAQFGVGGKKGGSFESLNEKAKEMVGGDAGAGMMEQLANYDSEDLMKMIQESMNDPATMEYLENFGEGMGEIMEQLASMDPEEMKNTITENLAAMTSTETLNSVIEQQDEVLESLLMQGLITEEQMLEFQNDPTKFQEQMAEAFQQMNEVFSDPEALGAAMEMMSGMADAMSDPESAMKKLADAFDSQLGDDDKIEEARLQLLSDPEMAGNPAFAAMFQDNDMLEILNDADLWREQVKKGREMMMGDLSGAGAGVGEL
jgi:hypothetical protein